MTRNPVMDSNTTLVHPASEHDSVLPRTYKLSFWRRPSAHTLTPIPLYAPTACPTTNQRLKQDGKKSFLYALPKLSLIEVLQNKTLRPVSLAEYQLYLETVEHSGEILEFYLAVEQVHATSDTLLAASMIRRIVHRYIQAGSICEINIDHAMRRRITDAMQDDPESCTELDAAQNHCFELMRMGSFPRFLHIATYKNIGKAEVSDRLNLAILGLVMCLIWIPLSLTQSWYVRRYRWCLFLPIMLFFAGIVQVYDQFCPGYALLGKRSMERYNMLGLLHRKDHSAEPIEQPCIRSLQRRKALMVWWLGVCPVSLCLTVIIWTIPVNLHG